MARMQLGKPCSLVELDDAEEHVDADGDDHPDRVEPTSHGITHASAAAAGWREREGAETAVAHEAVMSPGVTATRFKEQAAGAYIS